jgi:predicted transcriptional regulator of viral defense system
MKRTVLTQAQLALLEELMVRYGTIVTTGQVADLMPGESAASKQQFISRLAATGWLVRVKKGIYQIADVSSLGMITLSRYVVARILAPDSYVSFEAALQFHGLHDQLMQSTVSVALKQHKPVSLQGFTYHYVTTRAKYFYGDETHTLGNQSARIATAEKALIDMIQLRRSGIASDLVMEKLAQSADSLDLERLGAYLGQANVTTQRIFGLYLDAVGADTAALHEAAASSKSVSRLTGDSKRYSAKWRLYYDPAILAPHLSAQPR